MSAATEIDIGPLSWVKGEIDAALARAAESLRQLVESPQDLTHCRFARTHLHQARGALDIVGLDGLTRFAEILEKALQATEDGQIKATDEAAKASLGAIDALTGYLDDLLAGRPDQPLRLYPHYRALQQLQDGHSMPADLFFPDLSVRPPRRATPTGLDQVARKQIIKRERARFERHLLHWLRDAENHAAATGMSEAVAAIEATQDAGNSRAFWWVTQGFLEALGKGGLTPDLDTKRLCGRINLQIRRLFEGSTTIAERLMREALYHIAAADVRGPVAASVRDAFRLEGVLPVGDAAMGNTSQELRGVRELILGAKESWNRHAAGSPNALTSFTAQAATLERATAGLGQSDLKRLAGVVNAAAVWVTEHPADGSHEALAMEVATALLLLDNACEHFAHLDQEFASQVDLMVSRVHACFGGTPPAAADAPALLDEFSRKAQERLLLAQLSREMLTNLQQAEQVLDAYFRNPEKREELSGLQAPLAQVEGALRVLGEDEAVAALRESQKQIKVFAESEAAANPEAFDALAERLSTLGFFVESLQHGQSKYAKFTRPIGREEDEAAERLAEEDAEEAAAAESVEKELGRHRRELRDLMAKLRERPQDEALRETLRTHLQTIQQEASLVNDGALESQVQDALKLLARSDAAAQAALEEKLATPEPEPIAPSPEAQRLMNESDEVIDAELLAIFLEEAHEVLATIQTHKGALRVQPGNHDELTVIRRSFHTLKGSGRMVGLWDLGETAWAVEQTLNQWLQSEEPATPELLSLIDDADKLFQVWVAQLEAGTGSAPDVSALVAAAEALRSEEDALAVATGQAAGPAEAVEVVGAAEEQEGFEIDLPELTLSDDAETDGGFGEDAFSVEALDLTPDESAPEDASGPASDGMVRIGDLAIAPPLFEIFQGEVKNHLEALHEEFATLMADPAQPTSTALVRAAHTLGSISGTVGLARLHELGGALEHALLRRDTACDATAPEALEDVAAAIDRLGEWVSEVRACRMPSPDAQMVERVGRLFRVPATTSDEALPDNVVELPKSGPASGEPAGEPDPEPEPETGSETELTTTAEQQSGDGETADAAAASGEAPVPAPGVDAVEDEAASAEAGETAQNRAAPVEMAFAVQDDIDNQLLPVFLEEADELSVAISAQLREWREHPKKSEPALQLSRLLHTLKGSARMTGAMSLGEMTHVFETGVEQAARLDKPDAARFDELESRFDSIGLMIERLRSGKPAAEDAPEGGVVALGGDTENAQQAMLRVRADHIDRLVNDAGELAITRSRIEGELRNLKGSLLDLTENVIRLRKQLREVEIQAESQIQSRVAQAEEGKADFDPLELDRFSRFQELTRMMAESVNDVATVQQTLLRNLDGADAGLVSQGRLNRELQHALMRVRMVPFEMLSERLYRIVRQTAKELGKRANLEISGAQNELDRSILEGITAPLEHLLRNAIAHGIETPEGRAAAGKPDIGEIRLKLAQSGNEIVLNLEDDGAGINVEKVRQRAISVGLVDPDADFDETQAIETIFTPGFSTADGISQIAGRGIGMDVVKEDIASLGGRIEITSRPGQGTHFAVFLPLTTAVTQALLIKAAGRLYALPSAMIEQAMELKVDALEAVRSNGYVEWLDNRYPFHYLPHLLGQPQAVPEEKRLSWILLVRSGAQRVAVLIDEMTGNREIVVKNVGQQLARVLGVAGATVLGDGQVVLILNPVALATRPPVIQSQSDEAVPAVPEKTKPVVPTVLVVDDSLTVRKITGRLLSREGYQVLTAKDGIEGLEQLMDHAVDVILSDIEMPRMDGFDFVRNVRADEATQGIPVIMITSRTADKHREHALSIGADIYLGKPYQEEDLLAHIAGFVRQKATVPA